MSNQNNKNKKQLGNKNSHKHRINRISDIDFIPYVPKDITKEQKETRKPLFKKVKELAIIISQEKDKDKLESLWNEKRRIMSKLEIYNY